MPATLLNSNKGHVSVGGSLALPSFNATAGSSCVVWIADGSASGVTSVQDNKGNVYTQRGTTQAAGSGNQLRAYLKENMAGGAGCVITITFASNADASAYYEEWGSVATASYDSGSLAQVGGNTTPPFTLSSGTLAQADCVMLMGICTSSGSNPVTHAESTGFTKDQEEPDGTTYWTGACFYRQNPSGTGAMSCSVTTGVSSDRAIIMFALKASAAGIAIAGTATTGSTGTATLTTGLAVAAAGASRSSGTVAVTTTLAVAGAAASRAAGASALTTQIQIAAAAQSASMGAASLLQALTIAAAGETAARAASTVTTTMAVQAAGTSSSAAASNLTVSRAITAASASPGTAAASLVTAIAVQAAGASSSSGAAALVQTSAIDAAAATKCTAFAALQTGIRISAAAGSTAAASSSLSTGLTIAAASISSSRAGAALTTPIGFAAAARTFDLAHSSIATQVYIGAAGQTSSTSEANLTLQSSLPGEAWISDPRSIVWLADSRPARVTVAGRSPLWVADPR